MAKPKRKLTPEQRRRRKEYKTIFINGKQKRVKRSPPDDDFCHENADPIYLLENGMYEELSMWEQARDAEGQAAFPSDPVCDEDDDDLSPTKLVDDYGQLSFSAADRARLPSFNDVEPDDPY